MFTYKVWKEFVIIKYKRSYSKLELSDIATAVGFSMLTIPIDIIASPIEIISGIIYLILKRIKEK